MKASVWRIRRKILAFRQRDVADLANISQSRYSLLERGEAAPTVEELDAIDRALELPDEIRETVCVAVVAQRHKHSAAG